MRVTLMVVTHLRIILDITCQIIHNQLLDITLAPLDDADTTACQLIDSTETYITSQHNSNTHALHFVCDIRLTPTALWAWKIGGTDNLILVIHLNYCVMVAVAEMMVDHAISCWNCNFHVGKGKDYIGHSAMRTMKWTQENKIIRQH